MMNNLNERLGKSFLGQTIARVGVREASKVMTTLVAWTSVHVDLGHEPSVEEYAVWWKVSHSTAYRELRAFREAWPEFDNPSEVADVLGIDLDAGEVMPNPAGLMIPQGGFG